MFASKDMGSKPKNPSFDLQGARTPDGWTPKAPDQTNAKSKLISEYISKFQLITRGGLFIDGFSAPQSRDHEDAWTARRVLEIEPKWIRAFWLCDIETRGLLQLNALKAIHHRIPRSRHVFVMPGDFNETIKIILKSPRMTRQSAIFALLDQRNTECHWSTVKALAARAGRTKIELLYFLGTSWLHRSLIASSRPERLAEIDRWWGGRDWTKLAGLSQIQAVETVAKRFSSELDYKFVNVYPIFQDDDGQKVAFHLIHASDHREAPKLMARAYLKIVGDVPNVNTGRQRQLFD
jgi:three-Cys-motif partner protein